MAGHSKWNNIRIRKGKVDEKRGKLFTKLAREILMAGKDGPDPESNFRLSVAIARAKESNMPKHNIERLLEKLAGAGGGDFEEITYEGYGPGGVAIMVEAATDNRNRTAAEVRHLFSKNGGNLGEGGCVAWIFEKRGQITVALEKSQEESLLMAALEAGALDMEPADEGLYTIFTEPTELHQVKTALEDGGVKIRSSEFTMLPKNTVEVDDENAPAVLKLTEALDDHDDVQNVYANFDISDEVLEKLGVD
ncbi:MAG: YebC/PmpR family DNA-binding transcriptional regulator [Vulcanimicrobiota bacterium]